MRDEILNDHIVDPFFLEENLNSQFYLGMLFTLIYLHMVEIIKQDDEFNEYEVVFQQI